MFTFSDSINNITADIFTSLDNLPDNLNDTNYVTPSEYKKLTKEDFGTFSDELSCGEFDEILSSKDDPLWTYSSENIDEAAELSQLILVRLKDGFLLAQLPFEV